MLLFLETVVVRSLEDVVLGAAVEGFGSEELGDGVEGGCLFGLFAHSSRNLFKLIRYSIQRLYDCPYNSN